MLTAHESFIGSKRHLLFCPNDSIYYPTSFNKAQVGLTAVLKTSVHIFINQPLRSYLRDTLAK